MQFLQVDKLVDYRKKIRKHPTKKYTNYGMKAKTHIGIHHSLTEEGSAEAYANYHIDDMDWPTVAYQFIIEKDGMIKWCNDLGVCSYHVGDSNKFAIGICLTGDFRTQEPTPEQYQSLYLLVTALCKDLNIPYKRVWGHQEFEGYAWKQCPALDMDALRGNLERQQYVPVQNNFNNDQKIAFTYLAPKIVEEVKLNEGNGKKMNLTQSQKNNLGSIYHKAYEKGIFSSKEWAEKATSGELTESQAAYLNAVILSKTVLK